MSPAKSPGGTQTCVSSATVDTPEEFDYAFTNLCDGGTIYIPANTEIFWDGPTEGEGCIDVHLCLNDKSFTIEGADSTSVLRVHGGDPLFSANDAGSYSHAAVLRNLKIVHNASGSGMFSILNYESIEITNVIIDMHGQSINVKGKSILIDGLDLEANDTGLTIGAISGNGDFDHVIQNSKLRVKNHNDGPIHASFSTTHEGTMTFENNVISGYDPGVVGLPNSAGAWLRFTGTLDAATINIVDNDLKKRTIELSGNGGDLSFNLDCNNTTLYACPDSLIVELPGNDFGFTVPSPSWKFNYGTCISNFTLGSITNQSACIIGSNAVMKFNVGHTAGVEPAMHVWVRWADDDCTTGPTNVLATYNASTGQWNAMFPVPEVEDLSFYWQGKAQLCTTTNYGTCQIRTTRECDGVTDPEDWFSE